MSGVSSVGAKALAAWTWCQDDSSEHKSSKADGLFPKKCPTLLPQSPGSQENRCYHPGMEMSVAGFLPRSLKNLGVHITIFIGSLWTPNSIQCGCAMEQFWSQTWLNEPQTCDLSWVKPWSKHFTSLSLIYTMGFKILSKEIMEKYFLNFKEKFSCTPATTEDCLRHLTGRQWPYFPSPPKETRFRGKSSRAYKTGPPSFGPDTAPRSRLGPGS